LRNNFRYSRRAVNFFGDTNLVAIGKVLHPRCDIHRLASVWPASLRRERSFGSQQPTKKIRRPNLRYVRVRTPPCGGRPGGFDERTTKCLASFWDTAFKAALWSP
jgi:hypothetical protein